jgi:hypothetical protein
MSRFACRLSRGNGASWYLPDKEFRYLRHFCYVSPPRRLGRFLFRLALHVAVEVGPYLHVHSFRRVQRMASEDSVEHFVH